MSKPVFMSPQHVERMNALLANDSASQAACAALDRRWTMVYELGHGRQTVWWTMNFDPQQGVFFTLEPPRAADILYRGDYRAMLQWMRTHKAGAEAGPEPVTTSGDPKGMDVIGPAYRAAQQAATIETEIPAA